MSSIKQIQQDIQPRDYTPSSHINLDYRIGLAQLGLCEYDDTRTIIHTHCPNPDHKDLTKSFRINLDKGKVKCFTTDCKYFTEHRYGFSIVKFLCDYLGISSSAVKNMMYVEDNNLVAENNNDIHQWALDEHLQVVYDRIMSDLDMKDKARDQMSKDELILTAQKYLNEYETEDYRELMEETPFRAYKGTILPARNYFYDTGIQV